MLCSVCQKANAPHFYICRACMDSLCNLDEKRYIWYQSAVKRALFPPAKGDQLPLSLPPVSFPANLEPEVCLFRISES